MYIITRTYNNSVAEKSKTIERTEAGWKLDSGTIMGVPPDEPDYYTIYDVDPTLIPVDVVDNYTYDGIEFVRVAPDWRILYTEMEPKYNDAIDIIARKVRIWLIQEYELPQSIRAEVMEKANQQW